MRQRQPLHHAKAAKAGSQASCACGVSSRALMSSGAPFACSHWIPAGDHCCTHDAWGFSRSQVWHPLKHHWHVARGSTMVRAHRISYTAHGCSLCTRPSCCSTPPSRPISGRSTGHCVFCGRDACHALRHVDERGSPLTKGSCQSTFGTELYQIIYVSSMQSPAPSATRMRRRGLLEG